MTKTDEYGVAVQALIDAGDGTIEAAKKVAAEKGIAVGTATAALYRWRRANSIKPEREATKMRRLAIEGGAEWWGGPRGIPTDWVAPTDLQDILTELNKVRAVEAHLYDALKAWAANADAALDQRALKLIKAAAK